MTNSLCKLILVFCFSFSAVQAQENVVPLLHNPVVAGFKQNLNSQKKTTALTLPFFEDFTGYDPIPDQSKWLDREVYVNNTMCIDPVSRGVATFDALNAEGTPYNNINPGAVLQADSLTSMVFDLSGNSAADSIYISFFYQPQGNGFSPETGDSLMLFLKKKYGGWTKVWAKEGSTTLPFKQAMVPVSDTAYFNDGFQFRFVNIASINVNDDVWNLDYIRVSTGRNVHDTVVNDIAISLQPSYLLNDYTYMPYWQFMASPAAERRTTQLVSVRNNYTSSQNISVSYASRDESTNTALGSGATTGTVAAKTQQQFTLPMFTNTVPVPANIYDPVVYENKYYINAVNAADNKVNDTITQRQIFYNYLAYDDGTAEKSYYLNMYQTLPAKIGIEFHLNKQDTVKGIAIYFGRQVPPAGNKYFSVFVNKDIAVNGGSEVPLHQEDFFYVNYSNAVNSYWVYKFAQPVVVPAGVFYIGVTQPAYSGSDSLYYGVDANRTNGNHLYYNVLNQWVSSGVSGALMVRPLLGGPVTGTSVQDVSKSVIEDWQLYPNPATDNIYIDMGRQTQAAITISDIQGRVVYSGEAVKNEPLSIAALNSGVYFVQVTADGGFYNTKKFYKQ